MSDAIVAEPVDVPAPASVHGGRFLVLAGGLSHERDVSLKSGRRVLDALRSAGADADLRDADAALLGVLAETGANVLDVEHARTDPGLHVGEVAVGLRLETRGDAHREGVLGALAAAGYPVSAPGSRP